MSEIAIEWRKSIEESKVREGEVESQIKEKKSDVDSIDRKRGKRKKSKNFQQYSHTS